MNIAVFHNLPSGGAKRALYNSVKYLKNAGHKIDVHVPSTANESYLPLKEIVEGFHVYPVRRTLREAIAPYSRFVLPREHTGLKQAQERIADQINAGPYDVVFCEQDAFVMTPFILRWLNKPTVYYCQQPSRENDAILQELVRTVFPTPAVAVPAYKKLWRAYLRNLEVRGARIDRENALPAKYILANSYFSRETILRAYGLNSYVSYLGVDADLFRPLRLPRENFVLSVGQCSPHKGFDFVIRALGLINARRRPKLILVSNAADAQWQAYLLRLAAEACVDLEIKTAIPDNEMVGLYNRARLFAYASFLEPFGLAPLEAMACGTGVVAVKEGGVRESVLHNETGILTDRNEAAFAEAITELVENGQKREQMGCRGVEVVRSCWTLRHAGQRLESHLKQAIEVSTQERGGGTASHGC